MVNRILGLVGWLGTALVFAAAATRVLRPEWDQFSYWGAWGGLVCILLYALGQWKDMARAFGRRQTRVGALSALSVLLVFAILVAINYLAARQPKRWDLTASKQFSLSEQTRKVIDKLDAPVKMLVFGQEMDFPRYRDELKEYESSSKLIDVEYIDADKKPLVAKQYGVQQYGTVVLAYKDRTERVTSNAEQDLTNGLIKLVTGKQKKVYFTQGHAEKDTGDAERLGYGSISAALGKENYTVEKLVLAQQGSVPADASVVVIAGPKTDFLQGEVDAISKYLDNAGKVLLMLDPPEKTDERPLASLIALAHNWGIEVGTNIVVDVSGVGQLLGTDASVPVAAPPYPPHPITENFRVLTAYPLARSVTPISGGVNGHVAQSVIQTSARSWAETNIADLMASKPVKLDQDKGDRPGPVSIASAVAAAQAPVEPAPPQANGPKSETRLVVFGDSDFATNAALGIQGNRDLFLNTVGWLAQQENLISIRPKDAADQRLTLEAWQQRLINLVALLLIPGLVILWGVGRWWRRR